MASNSQMWQDEWWPFVLLLYMRKPVGVKRMYSRACVNLALELHLPPSVICEKMAELRRPAAPSLRRLMERYDGRARALSNRVEKLRLMRGFSSHGLFYDGVEVRETWETDFRELPGTGGLTPVALILVLDLYFRLTPSTMSVDTPEVKELARLIGQKASAVAEVMGVYQILDPYLSRGEFMVTPLLKPCQQVWQRYGNGDIEQLAALAAQLKEYYE